MNTGFWEHLLNAASHLADAKRMSDHERAAREQAAADQRRAKRAQAERARPAPAQAAPSFSSAPPAADGACCISKRRFKVK